MEATVLSVGKSAVSGAVSYAQSAVAKEVALQLGVQRDQGFIRDELEMMQSFLMAAHDDRDRDDGKVVRTWVKQVRDLGYDVEDCLQDLAVRLEKPSWWRFLRTLLDRRHVAKQMKDLREKVEDVSQRNLRYRLIASAAGSKQVAAATAAEQYAAGRATMFGTDEVRRAMKRDRPRVDLAQLINGETKDFRVVAVWGTCGVLGQASVIRKVYDDAHKFQCRAWVKLTHPFDPVMFMRNIMRQFYGHSSFPELSDGDPSRQEGATTLRAHDVLKKMLTMKQEDLVDEFNQHVNNKSYLIVLNDLCTIEDWDWIRTYFPLNNNGNRIIVATQQVEVASLCVGKKCRVSELKQLSADQTLYVFYDKGPQGGTYSTMPESSSNTSIATSNSPIVPSSEIPAGDQVIYAAGGKNTMPRRSLIRIMSKTTAMEESQVVGRETEKTEILRLISDSTSKEFQVISVWGMGGLGKTALVKDIYQSQELGTFNKRACVTVMKPFDHEELLESLFTQLVVETSGEHGVMHSFDSANKTLSRSLENLKDNLKSLLKEKKWLIVFDDLSSTTEWDLIRGSLPQTENASRIIVTTREVRIANYCSKRQENVYKLEGLSKEHALDLFTKKVFKDNEYLDWQYPGLVEQAEQILKKCSGLPLAIVAIGGFLANQPKTTMEWRKLNENLSSELELIPELDIIRTVLLKSYNGLPYHLKACFLYLAIFPEDYKISLTRLVRRWIAEGYSREVHGKSAHEVAESYFMDLISRSMILPSRQSSHSRKAIDSCQLHDIIRDIGILKSAEENLVFRLEEGCRLSSQVTTRHLSVSSNWKGDEGEFEGTVDLSRVRSITIFGKWRPFFISDKMRLLRVLDLEGTSGLVDHHLKHIGKLFHLRYLSLRECHGIYHLPRSLGNLRQLETLDVTGTNIIKLPKNIIKLRKLQHIHGRGVGSNDEYVYDKEYLTRKKLCILTCALVWFCGACCAPQLLKEPMGIDGDTTRRDVCTACCCSYLPMLVTRRCSRGVVMPKGIHGLKALQTLGLVNVSRRKATLRDVARLTGLRKLGVTGVDESNGKELCSALANLRSLETLLVQSEGKPGLSGCLDDLSSPPENLGSLKLYGNLVKLPAWINGGLKNLAKLKLRSSRIEEHDAAIQVLGSLPNLAILRLRKESFKSEKVHLHFQQGAFQTLMVLELSSPGKLKSVVFDTGAAPKLELLQYYDQPEEEVDQPEAEVVSEENGDRFEAPGVLFSGLAFLGSLKEVLLEGGNHKADFLQNLRSQLASNPKRPVLKME